MTPGETGGNTIFYFIQPRRGATKKILSQRNQVAKNLFPKPKKSAGLFCTYLRKKIPRAAAYGGDHNPAAILHLFCIATCGALKTNLRLITPGFTGGHRCIDPSDLAFIRYTKTIFSTMGEIQLG